MEQDLLTLPEHLRSTLVFGGVRVAYSLVFHVVSCVLLFVCLSFSFLAMALSVYFRFMSLTVPLVSFVPLLYSTLFAYLHSGYLMYQILKVFTMNQQHFMFDNTQTRSSMFIIYIQTNLKQIIYADFNSFSYLIS